jgi:peptidoglycan/xylan/chitin deacetylase (PgdA/CDA1 family)
MRGLTKRLLFGGARWSGANRLLRRRTRNMLLVLCYHGVVVDGHPHDELRYSTTVSLAEFRQQLQILQQTFRCVSAADVRDWLAGRQSLPASPVLITFDDGFRNNLTLAAPELARLSMPALLFVATGHIGRRRLLWTQELVERGLRWPHARIPSPAGPDRDLPAQLAARRAVVEQLRAECKQAPQEARERYLDRLRETKLDATCWDRQLYEFLSWDEVAEIRNYGFDIGSHTVSHPILSRIDASRLRTELRESKRAIETRLGQRCDYLAYPNGTRADYNDDVLREARAAGYLLGFTLNRSLNTAQVDPLAVDRVDVAGHAPLDVFRARVSGLFTWIESWRRRS